MDAAVLLPSAKIPNWDEWISNPWLCWGVGGYLASGTAYFLFSFLLETMLRMPLSNRYLITYGGKSRAQDRQESWCKVAFLTQLKGAATELLGPAGMMNGVAASLLMPLVADAPKAGLPSAWELAFGVVLMALVNDCALYLGHRVQHENDYLWNNCHSVHHTIGSPTPVSTIYIDSIDMTLQGGLPILCAAAAAGLAGWLHPVTFYVFVMLRVGENVCNHSG
jgi:sterol desaturase/sphingolipid hydroxylase (fatty acid hydroxylase superfamily)